MHAQTEDRRRRAAVKRAIAAMDDIAARAGRDPGWDVVTAVRRTRQRYTKPAE
jgi:hypothetical protein